MKIDNSLYNAKKWHLLQLKPNGYTKAQLNLERQNFETFMPLCRVTTRKNQFFKEAIRPVFPGYLFVRFDTESSDWRKINSTLGVAHLISFERDKPARVPGELIAGLKLRCDGTSLLMPPNDLECGQKMQVAAGSFAGFVGTIEQLISDDRVRILFDFMGREVSAVINRKELSYV